jgi:hypothetical protein
VLEADDAAIYVGAEGNERDVVVRDGERQDVFHVNGNDAAVYVGVLATRATSSCATVAGWRPPMWTGGAERRTSAVPA